jgi:hypothetical protein
MAIMVSEDKKELIVTCECGCEDIVHIKVNDEDKSNDCYGFITYANGNFYCEQENSFLCVLKRKIKKIWAIICNKDYCYSEILMSYEDFQRLKEYINQF